MTLLLDVLRLPASSSKESDDDGVDFSEGRTGREIGEGRVRVAFLSSDKARVEGPGPAMADGVDVEATFSPDCDPSTLSAVGTG